MERHKQQNNTSVAIFTVRRTPMGVKPRKRRGLRETFSDLGRFTERVKSLISEAISSLSAGGCGGRAAGISWQHGHAERLD